MNSRPRVPRERGKRPSGYQVENNIKLQAENNKKLFIAKWGISDSRDYTTTLRYEVIFVLPQERSDFHAANQSVVYRIDVA